MDISNNGYESKLSASKNEGVSFKAKLSKNKANYLSVETIRKMILRFLSEKQIPKQKLAAALGITEKSLLRICLSRFSVALIAKINLPLVRLYCKTKF